MKSPKHWTERTSALAILLFICLLVRAILWLTYEPAGFPDSETYLALAHQIARLDFTGYLGMRTPVYPLLLLLVGLDPRAAWLLQSVLGITISVSLFYLASWRTGNVRLALLAGASYSLSLNLIFFEAFVLTETLSAFLLVVSFLLYAAAIRPEGRMVMDAFLLGLVVALAGLTRPLLLFLGPLYLLFLLPHWLARPGKKDALRHVLAFGAPVTLLVLGWCVFNQVTVGYFGSTTLTGYNLTQQSGAFIELAPDRYSAIKQVYLKYRQLRIQETGDYAMTIWRAYPEMLQVTGLSYGELSRELTAMSVELFIRHPFLYAQGIFKAWLKFWSELNMWDPSLIRSPSLRAVLQFLWAIERPALAGIEIVFLVLALGCVSLLVARRRIPDELLLVAAAIVVVASLLQAMLEYGENGRYAIPFQPLILYSVLTTGAILVDKSIEFTVRRRESGARSSAG